jgi:hypothetical protein
MTRALIVAIILLAITLGSWFLLGPKPPEKDVPHYAVHVVAIREYSPDEMVSIANQGQEPVDISGWTLWAHRPEEARGIAYHFPDGCVLNGLQMVRVHSGPDSPNHAGTQCAGTTPDLYWTLNYVWCDANGDTAYLYDTQGNFVDHFQYGGGWHESPSVPCAPGGD